MLEIQKFLIGGGTFQELEEKYAIKAKQHKVHNNIFLFKYDQFASPFDRQIVREARGILLDRDDSWKVVARAMNKFFNHGEIHAAEIDWSSAKILEKVDGSLFCLSQINGKWNVSTTGMPDASGEIETFGLKNWELRPGKTLPIPLNFSELFWQVYSLYDCYYFYNPQKDPYCFFFELTSPLNRVVVQNKEAKLTLLGARDLNTQQEIDLDVASKIVNIPPVKQFPLQSIEQILESLSTMNGVNQEGYVIVDKYFNRIKAKCPGYTALHHAKDGMGTKAFVEIARSGETSEVESAFPEFKPMLEEARNRLSNVINQLEEDYQRLKDIPEQKEFALKATKESICSTALFQVRAGKVKSIKEFIRNMRIESLLMLLGYK